MADGLYFYFLNGQKGEPLIVQVTNNFICLVGKYFSTFEIDGLLIGPIQNIEVLDSYGM